MAKSRGGRGGGWPGVPLALDVPVSRVEGMALPGAVTYSWRRNVWESRHTYTRQRLHVKVYTCAIRFTIDIQVVGELWFGKSVDFFYYEKEEGKIWDDWFRNDSFFSFFLSKICILVVQACVRLLSRRTKLLSRMYQKGEFERSAPKVSPIDCDSQGHLSFPTMDIAWNDPLR